MMMALGHYVIAFDLGWVYSGSVGYVLKGHRNAIEQMRKTDIALVLKENLSLKYAKPYYRAPDLAIEIISDDLPEDAQQRLSDFLDNGTQQVWQVYPEQKQIIVHSPDGIAKKYEVGDMIVDDGLLLRFQLDVAMIFEE